jgi:hypothetical protein
MTGTAAWIRMDLKDLRSRENVIRALGDVGTEIMELLRNRQDDGRR